MTADEQKTLDAILAEVNGTEEQNFLQPPEPATVLYTDEQVLAKQKWARQTVAALEAGITPGDIIFGVLSMLKIISALPNGIERVKSILKEEAGFVTDRDGTRRPVNVGTKNVSVEQVESD